jgi:hypothetical protein
MSTKIHLALQGSDDDFTGPNKDRSCTDILCLALFVAFMVGMVRPAKRETFL